MSRGSCIGFTYLIVSAEELLHHTRRHRNG
jgi:hypothetical protein